MEDFGFNPETVFVISDRDISVVQGSTEMYYLSRYFGSRSTTYVFAPATKRIPGANMRRHPFSGPIGTFLLNLVYLPYWIVTLYRNNPDLVYCYQNVISVPLLAKSLTNSVIVHDMRSDPCEQAREFTDSTTESRLRRYLLKSSEYLHRFILQRSHLVVTLSEQLADALVDNYSVNREQIHLLPLGVDTKKFTVNHEDRESIRFVYIGSIKKRRGIDRFVSGLKGLSAAEQEIIEFHLYGGADGGHIRELQQMSHGEAFDFRYHGHFPHDEVPEVLQAADVGVSPLPNLEAYRVSSPAKVYEYLASGLPVLASDITAHRRILDDECAFLVDPKPEQYIGAIRNIVSDREQLSSMSKSARVRAEANDWSVRFNQLSKRLSQVERGEPAGPW